MELSELGGGITRREVSRHEAAALAEEHPEEAEAAFLRASAPEDAIRMWLTRGSHQRALVLAEEHATHMVTCNTLRVFSYCTNFHSPNNAFTEKQIYQICAHIVSRGDKTVSCTIGVKGERFFHSQHPRKLFLCRISSRQNDSSIKQNAYIRVLTR